MYPIDYFHRSARRWAGRLALEGPRERLTYGDLAQRVNSLAAALQARSADGAIIGICAGNTTAHAVSLLAVMAAGRTWVPLNPRSAAPELRRIVEVTRPAMIITEPRYRSIFEGAAPLLLAGRDLAEDLGRQGVQALLASHAGKLPEWRESTQDAIQAIKFTGGTTGLPKGVMQPYRAWTACLLNQVHAYRFDETDRFLMAAPLTHGSSTFLMPVLATGGCHVLIDDSSPATILDAFRNRSVTATFLPPTMIYTLMEEAGADGARFPALRHLVYAAAPMPPEKVRRVREFFGPVLETSYGQTEAPTIVTFMGAPEFDDERNIGSVGRAALTAEVATMSPDGNLLPSGEIGEVVVRGDLVMAGYFGMPDKTDEVIVDGWLHTGDRGVIDDRGYLFLKDRLREVIITGGFNVYPVDVEDVLCRHPAVQDCAVFGVEDEKWGEAVHAAVQFRPAARVDEAEIVAFVKAQLGSVKAPKRVHIYENLPRSAVGKVQRKIVKEEVTARIRSR